MPLGKEKIDLQRSPVRAEGIERNDLPESLRVASIERIELEPDGQHMVVHSDRSTLTFHYSVFRELLAVLPAAIMQSEDRKSTRLNSSHTEIYTLSLHDALPI